ncbi:MULTISPECIES: Mur ligase family protein [Cryobacterium]|uniref:UDP-N-acetylmuramyl-tripeptide synthetase n=1 Tax=Cryobacterium mannosilyticum TaxID=1259190 RepID=A0A4R8WAU1_9MICO|nr:MULTISPECIES: UDP-N-acetylmuramoyl-L-alanyl-D-glutamate--2,6-diaminopimelate ligase [Cryobacterium]TFB97937.1 UDP-N-acetylmuramoyl-L-alanyl-D-glutamate--2,6-diaminopimelate ligase [Cryobacterium sp. HLT2-28]TFC04157.1 UDP-N-acetylmuramoyl-L-alanyl-D-glutamate--2,6-diaminopimelate ligase [Cryobacterium mannosilyticum]
MTELAPSALRPQHPVPRSLSGLVDEFELFLRGDIDGLEVTGVSLSSRTVQPGDLYVGVPGRASHGAAFAAAAREAGAVAILTDEAGALLAAGSGLPILVTPDARAALGAVAAWIYRTDENPATLFAVTGTNGKTSVVYLLFAILTQLGVVSGLTSTAERRIGDLAVVSALTTPEATELHALLARMREAEVRAVAIEVSAQALTRHRVDGLVFDVAGFTNLSHDHLDDYAGLDEYFQAKLELFQPDRSRRGVVTVDSDWGRRIVDECRIPVTTLSSRPDVEADWHMTIVSESALYTEFVLEGPEGRRLQTRVPLLGWFMAANAALAILLLVESGYDLEAIAHTLERDGGIDVYIPGRAERISGDRGPLVYIDYGHSPDAFLNTLAAIRKFTPGRVIMVFGADGDRDTTKRADMGAIAARGADVVVVTDFHPRFEDPAAIRATLLAAAREAVPTGEFYEVADPHTAFRKALSLAEEGDAILYAGPGHENYHEVAGVKIPYSARDDSRLALREAGWL